MVLGLESPMLPFRVICLISSSSSINMHIIRLEDDKMERDGNANETKIDDNEDTANHLDGSLVFLMVPGCRM